MRKLAVAIALAVTLGLLGIGYGALAQESNAIADPTPPCDESFGVSLQAHQAHVEPGVPVTFTAIFHSFGEAEYENVLFGYRAGMFGMDLGRQAKFGGGEVYSATFPMTAYNTFGSEAVFAVFDDNTFTTMTCRTLSPIVWVEVDYKSYLPIISNN